MKKNTLFALWGGLFVLCAGLGFLPEVTGFARFALVCLALAFFVPPALLLKQAYRNRDRHCVALIRNLALAWLVLTVALLVANFFSVLTSTVLGDVLYAVLAIVSAPMVCGQYWILTMFCWAFVLFTCNHLLKAMKNRH